MDCFCPFSLEGGPRRQKVGMRVKAGNSVLKRLTPPPQTRRPPLALSHEGRGNYIVLAGMDCFCPFSLEGGPRRQKVGMRVKADNSVFKRLAPLPLTLALSHEGRGNNIVLSDQQLLLPLLP